MFQGTPLLSCGTTLASLLRRCGSRFRGLSHAAERTFTSLPWRQHDVLIVRRKPVRHTGIVITVVRRKPVRILLQQVKNKKTVKGGGGRVQYWWNRNTARTQQEHSRNTDTLTELRLLLLLRLRRLSWSSGISNSESSSSDLSLSSSSLSKYSR
jgi:hypothetical protein